MTFKEYKLMHIIAYTFEFLFSALVVHLLISTKVQEAIFMKAFFLITAISSLVGIFLVIKDKREA